MARTLSPIETEDRLPTLEVFVLALSVILMEVGYTRIFSFKLVYYFAYLVIGIGLLGLGAGGIVVATSDRLRHATVHGTLLVCSLIAAFTVGVGYLVVAEMPLNLFFMVRAVARGDLGPALAEAGKLLVICTILTTPFLAVGVAFSKVFATYSGRIGFLYGADLVGAALGCMLVVPALVWLTPPGTVMLSAVGFAIAGLRPARARSGAAVATASLLAVAMLGVVFVHRLPDPLPDQIKGRGKRIESVFSRWHPVFRVDVMPLGMTSPIVHFLVHDGTTGSSMIEYDGNPASLGRYDGDERAYPFRMLPPKPRVAIIGSAGGNEILAAIHFDASSITGIELNPVTVSLLTDHFADFTGHLTRDPRVKIFNAEGRSFLASTDATFDLIWLVAPDTYAAMNAATSGAFVLSESYLYTEEMILEAMEHLSDDGILAAQFGEIDYDHKPNRTLRYLSTAREAFRRLGIDDFSRHVLVAVSPYARLETTSVLLRKKPFSPEDAARFAQVTALPQGTRTVYPSATAGRAPVMDVIELEGEPLESFHDHYAYDVRPIDDDSPFFWNFVRFRDLILGSDLEVNIEEGIGERLALALLFLSILFATALLATPVLASRRVWSAIPYKRNAIVYFGALGLGFMFIEICLIQRLTLLLGYPTYSLTVTLFSILVSSGIGSLASERWTAPRNSAFVALLSVLAGLVLIYAIALPLLGRYGIGWPFPIRVAVAILLIAPLGLTLGCFMPFGIRTVSATTRHAQEYVAWCWAVNGFFSVVGSVLATLLAMAYGFSVVLGIGLVVYLTGVAAFWRLPEPSASDRGLGEPDVTVRSA